MLLSSLKGREIAKRDFPISYKEWEQTNREHANLFYQYEPLKCKCCGKDLLADRTGIICFLEADNNDYDYNPNTPNKYTVVFWACKGKCDEQLLRKYEKMAHYNIGWEDISDILIPGYFMRWIMGHFNRLRDGDDEYTDEAYSKVKLHSTYRPIYHFDDYSKISTQVCPSVTPAFLCSKTYKKKEMYSN